MERLKRFGKGYLVVCVLWWLLVWAVGSWQAHQFLAVDDLIPTADKWLASWAAEGRQ